MRSVNVHLAGVTQDEVAAELDKFATRGLGTHWYYPDRANTALSIHFKIGPHAPQPPNSPEEIQSALGGHPPSLTVYVDIGGRGHLDEAGKHLGNKELYLLLSLLMEGRRAIARDDLTPRLWTWQDIHGGKQVNGAGFCDHETWRKLRIGSHEH